MIKIDLTKDIFFAGSETVMIEKDSYNNIVFQLILTTGDLDGVIGWIPYNETSNNQSFVYKYNTEMGFGADGFVQIIRLQEFYDQLIAITSQVHPLMITVLDALKQICNSTLQHGNRLFVKFE